MSLPQSGYYRFPTIHRDQVVFVCEDDLWSVSVQGGPAVRLTANLGAVSHPALSPDGTQLAFIGREEGDAEVYVMPAEGGVAKRLTFLGANTAIAGWNTNSSAIIFSSNASQPFPRLTTLHHIRPEGGLPELLPYGMANAIAFGSGGRCVLGRNIAEPAYWKRYRGGRVGVLWVDATGDRHFTKLLNLPGNRAAPMWIGERIYFISDHDGIGNLYTCTPTGEEVQRLTDHREFYVRHAATDGQRIVYQAGASLFSLEVASAKVQEISVQFRSPQVQRQRKFIDPGKYLEDYELHPEGHSVLITSRGRSLSFGNWEGAVIPIGQTDVGRYRLTRWLADAIRFITVCDRSGSETLEIHSSDVDTPPTVLLGLDIGRVASLKVSPVADQVVLTNHRHELIWIDVTNQNMRVLDRSQYGRIQGFNWSPDGQWMVYGFSETQVTTSIKLCQVSNGQTYRLTSPRFCDFNPTFDPDGKFIYFLSVRDFNPVYDTVYFDLNFPRATRPFLISLQAETPSPFVPIPQPLDGNGAAKEETASPSAAATVLPDADLAAPPSLRIDWEGIEQRVVGFPVPEGRYHQIAGLKNQVLFSSSPIKGSLDRKWTSTKPSTDAKIELYDFATQSRELVAKNVTHFKMGRDHKTLIYRSGDRLRVCAAKAQAKNGSTQNKGINGAEKPNRKTGWLDLKRVRITVIPHQEWQQMFREIWRLQQEQFWTADLSGVDWDRVYDRYRPLLDRVSTRAEFSDLIWEMQGELGTSHAYEMGGDYREQPQYHLGFLGADYTYDEAMDAYRITHIAQGDTWTKHAAPLQQIGLNVKAGDYLVAIAGQRLSQQLAPPELLVHQADCPVQITVADSAEHHHRTLTVHTLKDESLLRYREWVERNHEVVTQATEGRVGYVHIPDMGPAGYAEFHRYYLAEVDKPGLVVDVRFNRGGHVSQLILEKLARQRIGYDVPRWEQPEPYPFHSPAGPVVAVTNEHAGSDGDIFSHCFKLMGIGTLIGTRTWGGVIGISPRQRLVDLSIVTQPEFSFWFKDVGWQVENYGTDPDIDIDIPPHDWAAGNDPQLDKAIQLVLQELEKSPVERPDFSDRPQLHLPT
ncbi:S41 family peptidase [Oscillatoria sp. CS-180]|uniref:S41 family peptidase n=1 Tax=Oscillatoria sp. CS-180 TaxID=3021720 RepID=UPI00232DEFCE|nr:S41 family peptidase [Oscillatoria sp. CS-180]MDB9527538.1 S41 family peptidase [Oscillatoria sp. CS-180]